MPPVQNFVLFKLGEAAKVLSFSDLINYFLMTVFVEKPVVSPRSAKYVSKLLVKPKKIKY